MVDETFGNYLRRKIHEWKGKQISKGRREPSDAEFAKWVGVPTTSLSVWANDIRTPSQDSADLLAARLGVEVYDRLGLPRRMPRNKWINALADLMPRLSEESQERLLRAAEEMAEQKEEGQQNHAIG